MLIAVIWPNGKSRKKLKCFSTIFSEPLPHPVLSFASTVFIDYPAINGRAWRMKSCSQVKQRGTPRVAWHLTLVRNETSGTVPPGHLDMTRPEGRVISAPVQGMNSAVHKIAPTVHKMAPTVRKMPPTVDKMAPTAPGTA